MAPKTTDLAILFADISGSTRLYEILGDAAARAKVADCLEMLTAVINQHKGTVIKTIGDAIMCTFPSAEESATAACEMHEVLDDDVTEQTAAGPISLTVRVGMHFGPAILEAGDVFGGAVNVAARMASMAKGGQIITTQNAVDEMSPTMRASTRFIDRAPVKGKKETMDIFEVLWQQEDVTRMSTGVIVQPSSKPVRMRLSYHTDSVMLDADTTQVVMGRGKTADLTVNETLASRQHVRIEHRRGKFFIIDQSTNGTYVQLENDESFLRREEMPLSGNGMISLGRSFSENPQEVVRFESES
ncbi:MAG: adenylate/guanylate cyclase domain-containing protein [Gammaproteobacteria bacterium]|jgi:class 3 adenylate cyclase|nr:adenylate/guanylate cyclase domain-containing protein [Gammaproteobacteria bacterium]